MKSSIIRLWNEETGAIVSAEIMLVATILVLGVIVGWIRGFDDSQFASWCRYVWKRIGARFRDHRMWIIGIGSIYQIQMGQVDRANMVPCLLMCVIGMGYFLLNIYRGEAKGADKLSLMEFGAMLDA